ncbi:glycosyltransferase family 39 protein [uncultured Mucilaginibacter sp.]|uniref:ArnT family glycosyltransferase n=1 Tax=uncultured Mucilaginibacter sp. TaxID=797541 RepID=UPI0025DA9C82|nr:glycosyltransferase family 39 protein [uncultured Mucilaginibacter sp.]
MFKTTLSNAQANRYILFFLAGWTLLNTLQAATLGVHPDEAYYWIYSRFLDWGYYDHPPMVALFIRVGDSLIKTELGLRMLTVIASTVSVYLLWLIAKRYQTDARWFMLLISGLLAFHIYGFITTPDAPLLLFTILFYYVYLQYLEKNNFVYALILSIVIVLMLYSKYHGVLVLLLTLVANPKLFTRSSFYCIPVVAALLYLPHILWQVNHNYPSVNYHLFERSSDVYRVSRTFEFIPGQLLIAGPLIGWFLFYYGFSKKPVDAFTRCLTFNSAGIFIFFWFNTIKGNVQPHWTLIGFVPLILLVLIRLASVPQIPHWLYKLAIANAALVIAFRLILIPGFPAIKKLAFLETYFGYDTWAQQIKHKVGNAYVIMPVGFQSASKYNYYTHSLKGFSYDASNYRRTQFDLWPIEDSMQNKRAFYTGPIQLNGAETDSIKTGKDIWVGFWVDKVRTYQKVDIKTDSYKITAHPGQVINFKLQISNPYNRQLSFANNAYSKVELLACFYQGDDGIFETAGSNFNGITITPHQTANYTFAAKAPLKKGKYELIFSIRTTPFNGGRNSRAINFTVQ